MLSQTQGPIAVDTRHERIERVHAWGALDVWVALFSLGSLYLDFTMYHFPQSCANLLFSAGWPPQAMPSTEVF